MKKEHILWVALYRLFRPVVRIALRHGFTFREVAEILKCAFVDISREEHGLQGRPTNKSRIAAMTGLTRVEVARLLARETLEAGQVGTRHPLQRLVDRWMATPPAKTGTDAFVLDEQAFVALVHANGGDIPWQTLLRELERHHVAVRQGGQVRLLHPGFIPFGEGEETGLPFIGEDAAALIDTIDHNLKSPAGQKRFQRKVVFTALSPEGFQHLQQRAAAEGQRLLESLNSELESYVLTPDSLNSSDSPQRLVGLGIYVFDLQQPSGVPA